MDVSRRRFLFGTVAAVAAAAPIARALAKPPELKPFADRSSYAFTVLPDPRSMVEPNRQQIAVKVYRLGETRMLQIERGKFPTSYIPTLDIPVARAADRLSLDGKGAGGMYVSNGELVTVGGFNFERASVATRIHPVTGKVEVVPPNVPRVQKEGVLIEERRSNVLLHSDGDWPWQEVRLPPGDYVLSWHGSGYVKVEGEAVAIIRSAKKWARIGRDLITIR